MNIEKKRMVEVRIVACMIDVYEKGNPGKIDTGALKEYAAKRISCCPRMAEKTFCSACPIHCYRKKEQEEIREVMRYAGPRMLVRHPLMTLSHMWIDHHGAIVRLLWLLAGFGGLVLGVIGALLPLLPAFPFLLLAAIGFGKSSPRLHAWFIQTKLYEKNLKDWQQHRAMTRKTKVRVMGVITVVMAVGFVMMGRVPWAQAVLAVIWAAHVWYFTKKLRTLPEA